MRDKKGKNAKQDYDFIIDGIKYSWNGINENYATDPNTVGLIDQYLRLKDTILIIVVLSFQMTLDLIKKQERSSVFLNHTTIHMEKILKI